MTIDHLLKIVLGVLLAVVGYFLTQANGTLTDTQKQQSSFQTKVVTRLGDIAGDLKSTVSELHAHEQNDRDLRAADLTRVQDIDRRVQNLERIK